MPWFEEGAEGDMPTELEVLSTHPCLRLVAFSEQPLLCRYSRRLVTMEKTR